MGNPRPSRRAYMSGAIASAALLTAPGAQSQAAFPSRVITQIIPFPPGGLFDTVGRPIAERMKLSRGTIIIENICGAASTRGAAAAALAIIASAVERAIADLDLQAFLAAGAFDLRRDGTADALRTYVSDEIARWRPIVDASGFRKNRARSSI